MTVTPKQANRGLNSARAKVAMGALVLSMALVGCGSTKTSIKTTSAVAKADTTKPTITAFSASPAVVSTVGATVTISANATDDVAVTKVEFLRVLTTGANPVLSAPLATFTTATGPWNHPFSFSNSSSNGSYTYLAKVYDAAGNVATSANATYRVDLPVTCTTACPAINSLVASPTNLTAAGNVVLTANPNANVTRVEFWRKNSNGTEALIFTDNAFPFAATFTFSNSTQNGSYTYFARGYKGSDGSYATSGNTTYTVNIPACTKNATGEPLPGANCTYTKRFQELYAKIKNPANGYFNSKGVPYHAVETLMVEAPDYGHETTSEAYSYYLWLEAVNSSITGDWSGFSTAWNTMETYSIPSATQQPTNNVGKAAYAPEHAYPDQYPSVLNTSIPVGDDPFINELNSTYGTKTIYGMHWIQDVDNWYGYGNMGNPADTNPSYMNTFQRGAQESVWETVPHPSFDTFKSGWGKDGRGGYVDLFVKENNPPVAQWRYTNAPDADARAVQAAYWAMKFADAQGKKSNVSAELAKAAKMGDYLRYSLADKYFKPIGNCTTPWCAAGTGKNSLHYLLNWYYAWGGALDGSWGWRIGSSHNHGGYQNPMAAWVLANVPEIKPLSPTAQSDWAISTERQIEFYRWLQSAEGAIGGGATNSWAGDYGQPPAGTPTFYGMAYEHNPVYLDPGSNTWFGFQAWSVERVAEYYYLTGNATAKTVLDKWVNWTLGVTTVGGGTFALPGEISWTGAPDTWNAANPGANANLHVTVVSNGKDVGIAGSLAQAWIYYAAGVRKHTGSLSTTATSAKDKAKALLDVLYTNFSDSLGVTSLETRGDYKRFDDAYNASSPNKDGIFIPAGWTGKMPNGDVINANSTFLSIRSKYTQDPQWSKVQTYLNGGAAPTFTYHRFWAQANIAIAYADYARFFE